MDIPYDARLREQETDAQGLPAFADDGTDLTVIRWMLKKTPEERLRWLQTHMQSVAVLTRKIPG